MIARTFILLFTLLVMWSSTMAGEFKMKYYRPENAHHQELYKVLRKNHKEFFGDAVMFLNKLYNVPNDVKIIVADCGSRNSRYNLRQATIYICYETLQFKIKDYNKPPKNSHQYTSRVFKNSVFTFWHEIGHALIHQLGLPNAFELLNEEDLADEFAVLSMIWRHDDRWTKAIVTSSLHYKYRVIRNENEHGYEPKYKNHGPNKERYYNMNCLLYGAKKVTFKRLRKWLDQEPKGSARCSSYYKKRNEYWSGILRPHTKYEYF